MVDPDPLTALPFNSIMIDINPNAEHMTTDLTEMRNSEYSTVLDETDNKLEFIAVYSIRKAVVLESVINVARTFFVIVVLAIAFIYFNNTTNRLVLNPIERMLEKVRLIATNPLAAASDQFEMAGAMSMMAKMSTKKEKHKELETQILEQAITKIGHLLAIGFGDAGTTIIAKNMNSAGDMNPMTPGQKTYAIFGFCDIHHFNDLTEVLQTDICTFVNLIAEITHSQTTKYGGAPNKNIGEAFILVWKYKNPEEFKNKEGIEIKDLLISLGNRQIADMALFAFLKVITKIHKYSHIVKYNMDKDIQEAIPDYKVKMGFGLHTGWAIEGAIGSFFKIDASYLSPNVNMAARLESSSKQYKVPLLVSGDFYEVLTKDVKNLCREIDTVTVKGSIRPVRLFTVDVEVDDLSETRDRFARLPMKMKKREYERERVDMWSKLDRGRKSTMQVISGDKDFMEIRRHHN